MTLPVAYLNVPTTRANLVQGPNGVFADANGSSRGISTGSDLERLLALRRLADVVLTDGKTARQEKYSVPHSCDLAVFTNQGFNPKPGPSTHQFLQLRMGVSAAVARLLELGYKHILLECGPRQLAKVIEDGMVDQLCLTNTRGSKPDLSRLSIQGARELFCEEASDATFRIYDQIRGSKGSAE